MSRVLARALPAGALAVVAGCTATAALPRFPPDVAAALVAHDMRRLETDTLVLYYPAGRGELARRTAARIAACQRLAVERARIDGGPARARPVIVMPELPFNNAFVMPRVTGYETVAVVPTENTLDFATAFGLPPDPGWVGCHEIIHHVHEAQFTGFWGGVNWLFGAVLSPQNGLDPWFWEGLATYYEDGLSGGGGRLHWPVWRGLFAAAYAGGGVDGDDLSYLKRQAPPGHHYLVGSHFIAWLARTYGEDRLWQLVAEQGDSVAFLLAVNRRFQRVYGRSLSALLGEFDAHLRQLPRRPVPPGQVRLRTIGSDARYARAVDGSEAVVAEGLDVPTHLEVRGPDGAVRLRANLVDLIAPRRLVIAAPILVSGMSFTADGTLLYLTVIDLDTTYQTTRLLRVDVRRGTLEVVASGLGPGGAVSPDGARYWVAAPDGDAWGLAEVELATGTRRVVLAPTPGRYELRVAPSPRGDRLAISRWDGRRFVVAVVSTATWREERVIAGALGQPVYDASWVDDDRLLYLAEVGGRFQAHVHELPGDVRAAISDAPYVAFEPRAARGTVRFLDREGWRWELAEVPLPAAAPTAVSAAAPPAAPAAAPPAAPAAAPTATAPAPAPPALTPPSAPPLRVLGDRPYRAVDGLFRPQLHSLLLAAPGDVAILGAGLAGGDRLGLQRWALAGFAHFMPRPVRFSVAGGYQNAMLAPWNLTVEGAAFRWHHPLDLDPDQPGFEDFADRRARDLVGSVGRVLRGTTGIAALGLYSEDHYADRPPRLRLGGVGLSLAHDNLETTPYGGIRRRLALALEGALYPAAWSSLPAHLVDHRAELRVTAPLPATRRHTVGLVARHRRVAPGEPVEGLVPLEVGGAGPFLALWRDRAPPPGAPRPGDGFYPERLRFVEPLRGFEDAPLPAQAAALGALTWRYPIPIDAGWATTLYLLPATLLRQLDLDLFGAGGLITPPAGGPTSRHLAVGGALTVSLDLFRIPVLLQYQLARRLTDDEALVHQVGIAVGL
jgi:hypothetical protein